LLYKKRVEAQTVARSLFNEQTVLVQLNELERQLVNLRFNGRALILNHAARMRPVPISVAVKRRLMRCISIVMGNPIPRT
jgi:hypothetical protein